MASALVLLAVVAAVGATSAGMVAVAGGALLLSGVTLFAKHRMMLWSTKSQCNKNVRPAVNNQLNGDEEPEHPKTAVRPLQQD